jgi:hypothetical protein
VGVLVHRLVNRRTAEAVEVWVEAEAVQGQVWGTLADFVDVEVFLAAQALALEVVVLQVLLPLVESMGIVFVAGLESGICANGSVRHTNVRDLNLIALLNRICGV